MPEQTDPNLIILFFLKLQVGQQLLDRPGYTGLKLPLLDPLLNLPQHDVDPSIKAL